MKKNQIINIEGSVSIQHKLNLNEKEANERLKRDICADIAREIYDNKYFKVEAFYDCFDDRDCLKYAIKVVKEDSYE